MPKRVAIVEDEAELAALIEFNLTRGGFQAQIWSGGEGTLKALEQCEAGPGGAGRDAAGNGRLRAVPADPPVGGAGAHAGAVS